MLSKKDIRPVLNLDATSKTESFQNKTLRPILKLQHSIILLMFKNWSNKHKINLFTITPDKFTGLLETSFSKNTAVKNQLLGVVIGQFTSDEYVIYEKEASEYNKRIFTMIKQRLVDSLEELKSQN
ncbi:glyoxalase [Tenacibaculum geojense]|uniref:Glyoxalase n=1 Tax=Tenacibaculum geojense TaxID=915352 RepID=A0ABW3JTA1_9FLAO